MSSKGELTSKNESIKILRAPGKKHKDPSQRSFFGRLFRRRKQPCSIHETDDQGKHGTHSAAEDIAKSEELIEDIEREVNTYWPNQKNMGKASRCKEQKHRQNQSPKTPYKAQVVERLQDQSLGSYTESKSLGMSPAISTSNKGKSCDESTNDVLLPSTESDLPKTRKGALKGTQKPLVAENPVVNYTHGYQSDSDSASSSSSSELDRAGPPPPSRASSRPAVRSMPSICYSMNRPDVTDEDRRRLHAYLNQFSSVHISRNLKDPIPKDPETLPGFRANMSRRRMAEALSKHGSTVVRGSQASSQVQNRKNAKGKKKKSWFFPAKTGDVTMPGEEMGADTLPNQSQELSQPGRSTEVKHVKNGSQVSTEVRCHDLTKKSSTSSTKTLEKSDKTDEDVSSGSASGIGKDRSLKDRSSRNMSPQHRSQREANTPLINHKKSYRSIHGNSKNEVLENAGRVADENRGKCLSPEEVERKEKFLGSVECDSDDHPPGVSNQSKHIVHHVLAGKTFCTEKDLGEKRQEYSSTVEAAQHCETDKVPARKKTDDTRAESRINHRDKRTTTPAPTSDCNTSYTKYNQEEISWERTSSPQSRQRSERSDLNANSTINWTIIMKHTRKKHESSSTDSQNFTEK